MTYFLIATSIAVFLLYRFLPAGEGFRAANLLFLPFNPNPATALSHAFFHTGWVHLAGNMIYLFIFGRALEDRFGPGRYFLIFALSAMAGAYTHLLLVRMWSPELIRVAVGGASGATSGLLGTFIIRLYFVRIKVAYWVFMPLQAVSRAGRKYIPAIIGVVVWFIYQAVYALVQFHTGGISVAYGVHVGGFLAGILIALLFGASYEGARERYLVRARNYFRKSEWFAAQGQYLQYLELVPEDTEVRSELARCYLCTSDHSSAQKEYEKGIRDYLRNGRRDRAEQLFHQAIKSVRGFRICEKEHLDLAFGAERSMKYNCAAAAYEHFLASHPVSGRACFVLLRLASLKKGRLNRPEEAEKIYRRIISDFPESEWAEMALIEYEQLAGETIELT